MLQVNMHEAKTDLSKLVHQLETRSQDTILIARDGTPVVQMTLLKPSPAKQRIGVAKGSFTVPDEFDSWDAEVGDLFEGEL